MIVVKIRGAGSPAKMVEIKPLLGELHQLGTYWRLFPEGAALCVDYRRREDADLVVNRINALAGVRAEIEEQGPACR